MTGFDLLELVREERSFESFPVIMLVPHGFRRTTDAAVAQRANDCVVGPFDEHDLGDVVVTVLANRFE